MVITMITNLYKRKETKVNKIDKRDTVAGKSLSSKDKQKNKKDDTFQKMLNKAMKKDKEKINDKKDK